MQVQLFLHFAFCMLNYRVLYTASMNILVVQVPVVDPYRPSKSSVGRAALICSSVLPCFFKSRIRSRIITSMLRYEATSAVSDRRPRPGTTHVPPCERYSATDRSRI